MCAKGAFEVSELSYVDSLRDLSTALKPVSEWRDADAAVALLLKPVNKGFEVLFVKRVENLADPWSGQMAFPGGKRDANDNDLKQTVLRETLEETSINLPDCCRLVGVMEALRSTRRPEMMVLPFVFVLEREPTIRLNEELEEFFWISLEELVKRKGIAKLDFGEVPAYVVGNCVIWGLTYRILEKFVRMIECPG